MSPESAPDDTHGSPPGVAAAPMSRRRRRIGVVSAVTITIGCVAALLAWQSSDLEPAVSAADRSTTTVPDLSSTTSSRPTTTTTATTTTTTAPPPPTTTLPPPPVEPVVAPLTGLIAERSAVERPAIISKIDGSVPAMPPVGMELADMVVEVRIEDGFSRYISVWHSRDPAVIGPHRSARTTDPNLISMFGHPHFAYSGANDKVVQFLAGVPWKTDVAHGAIPEAYFRDESRPYPHNLFARPDVLRTRKGPPIWPGQLFFYRGIADPPTGLPVQSFRTSAGPPATFTWDPGLAGWRRRIHDREHVHANGEPIAPTNVVVVETPYGISFADARSPEALSLGFGRAWVFTNGHVTAGTWARTSNAVAWDLRDAFGVPMTLTPGSTWVVVADGEPRIDPPV